MLPSIAMGLRSCTSVKICRNSIRSLFLEATFVLTAITVIFFVTHQPKKPQKIPQVNSEYLVKWRPSLKDSNISRLIDFEFEKHKGANRPLIFITTEHSGSSYFSFVIKETISSRDLDVKVFDVTQNFSMADTNSDQTKEIQKILEKERKNQLIFIESNGFDFSVPTKRKPFIVVIIRDPVEVALSWYHHKLHGTPYYQSIDTFNEQNFEQRVPALTTSFNKCVKRKMSCARGLFGPLSMIQLFSGMSLDNTNSKTNRIKAAIPRAKYRITSNHIFVAVMEDIMNIPFVLENLSPNVCKNLVHYTKIHKIPSWGFHPLNISDQVRSILIERDEQLEAEYRFYNWARARYFASKRKSFEDFLT